MSKTILALLTAGLLAAMPLASAAEEGATPSALTCDDFRPTPEALNRFPDLIGACEGVVERDGEEVRSVKASPDAPLEMIDVGDQVRLRVTTAVAVSVERP